MLVCESRSNRSMSFFSEQNMENKICEYQNQCQNRYAHDTGKGVPWQKWKNMKPKLITNYLKTHLKRRMYFPWHIYVQIPPVLGLTTEEKLAHRLLLVGITGNVNEALLWQPSSYLWKTTNWQCSKTKIKRLILNLFIDQIHGV